MLPKRFTDPLGSKLPALERSIVKLRAMEMILVLFYAEELKRGVLNRIQTTDQWKCRLLENESHEERAPKGKKNPVDKALNALVADRAITLADKKEIVELIDYRNAIGHQMHNLVVDLSPEQIARTRVAYAADRFPKYNYGAVKRLQHFLDLLGGLYRTHHYVMEVNFDGLIFEFAEKTFLAEIKRLNRKISKLLEIRKNQVKKLNAELSLVGTELQGENHPRHPLNQYDDGRLTKRGAEVCYRLYDVGKSPFAVAHLTGLSLKAAQKRKGTWKKLGGSRRAKVDIATIPDRKFYRRYDD